MNIDSSMLRDSWHYVRPSIFQKHLEPFQGNKIFTPLQASIHVEIIFTTWNTWLGCNLLMLKSRIWFRPNIPPPLRWWSSQLTIKIFQILHGRSCRKLIYVLNVGLCQSSSSNESIGINHIVVAPYIFLIIFTSTALSGTTTFEDNVANASTCLS